MGLKDDKIIKKIDFLRLPGGIHLKQFANKGSGLEEVVESSPEIKRLMAWKSILLDIFHGNGSKGKHVKSELKETLNKLLEFGAVTRDYVNSLKL